MRPFDRAYLGFLLAGGVFIWMRDTAWVSSASQILPIAATFPLFFWLGGPWRLRPGAFELRRGPLGRAGALLVLGLALDLTWPLAAGWTLALWSWLSAQWRAPHRLECS